MFRRVLSIVFYALAGMFLMSQAAIAFATSPPDMSRGMMLGVMVPFVLVPLGIGLLLSPGRRMFEAGVVVLVAVGWVAAVALTMAYILIMPDSRALMPPEIVGMFQGYVFGTVHLAALGAVGLLLILYGRRRPVGSKDGVKS